MKIGLFNKKIWKKMTLVASVIAAVETLAMGVGGIFPKQSSEDSFFCFNSIVGFSCVCFFLIWYFIELYRANHMESRIIIIQKTKISIKFGDVFSEYGRKVINFNEYFDTLVDDKIINKNSLNGIVIRRIGNLILNEKKINEDIQSQINGEILKKINAHTQLNDDEILSVGKVAVDNCLKQDTRITEQIKMKNCPRLRGGKNDKYELGTISLYSSENSNEDFYLLAFSQFDKENNAFHSISSFVSCLMRMWDNLDVLYAQKPIVMPLLGGGITRFKNEELTEQELLKLIIWSFKQSHVKFVDPSSLTIVLREDLKDKINLYEVD